MDMNTLQYYDPTPPREPEPWWKERRFLITAGLVLFAVVVLALIVVFLVNTVFLNKESSNREAQMDQVEMLASQLAAECEVGDAECRTRAQANAAREVGAIAACEEVTEDLYASCVALIAIDARDPQLCAPLTGTDKEECRDSAYLLLAKEEDQVELCAQIQNSVLRISCEQQIGGLAANIEAVVATGDPSQCESLSVDDEASCRDILYGTDTDGDGLSDGDEFEMYKTDPKNADTDGDTYSDGTEVESGHDPLS